MRRALICEDNATTGLSLATQLSLHGYESEWAGDGEAALVKLGGARYDVLVIDYFLPAGSLAVVDGLALLRRLREQAAYRTVPAVIITAAADRHVREMRREVEELQPATLLRKPFDLVDLLAALEQLLGGQP
jgi:CheY-like chemotaxis protein